MAGVKKSFVPNSCRTLLHPWKIILFLVRMPVLLQNTYCTWTSSSVLLSTLHSTLYKCSKSHIRRLLWISQTDKILVSSMVMTRERGVMIWSVMMNFQSAGNQVPRGSSWSSERR